MTAYRYYRLYITAVQSSNAAAELDKMELRSTVGGSDLAVTGNGTATASSEVGGQGPQFAFDASTLSWLSSVNVSAGNPQWIKWDFGGSPQDIVEMKLKNGANATSNSIITGTLQVSNDDADWLPHIAFVGRSATLSATTTHAYISPAIGQAPLVSALAVVAGYSGASGTPASPMPTLAIFPGGSAQISAPLAALTTQVAGEGASLSGPGPSVISTGHGSAGERAASLSPPAAVLTAAYGGANARLAGPSTTLAITGTATGLGQVSASAPSATLSASGLSGGASSAELAPGGTYSLVGYSGAVCSVTVGGATTLLASGTSGAVGAAALTLPLFELTASGTLENWGEAALVSPSAYLGGTAVAYLIAPGVTMVAIGTATVTATYEAYSINLNHSNPEANDEVTRYTNFPFTQIVRYQGSYFGVAADGLYLLEGTTDHASPTPNAIPWAFKTATTDFKEPKQKTVGAAYFSGRLGPAAAITLYAGEGAGVAYAHSTPRGALAQNYRQVFGKGVKARYYALGAAGTGTMELDGIEFDIHTLTRRI